MIRVIIDEIYNSLENGNFIVALTSALTIPDACGKIEYPNEGSSKKRYINWYEKYVAQYDRDSSDTLMPYPDSNLVYDLRCSMLHEGNPRVDLKERELTRFVLLKTRDYSYGGMRSIDCEGNRTLEIAIWNFCFQVCEVARHYYEKNIEKFNFNYRIEERNF